MSKVPTFDAATDRRPDHGAAIAGGQRPGDRVRRAEGARRGGRERRRGAAQRSQPVHARPRDLPALSARSRGPAARGHARVVRPIRRCASPPTGRCGAPDLDVMPVAARLARDADPGVRREVALSLRDQPAAAVARHPGRHRARLRRARIAAISKRWAPAPPARSRRSTIGCGASSASRTIRSRWSRRVRVDRVAAARARGGAGSHRARAVVEAVARRPPARARHARLHQGSRRVEGDAQPRGSRTVPLREPATWWLLNRMSERLGGLRPAAGAQGGRHLRSRRDRAEGSRHAASRRRICRSCRSRTIVEPHRRRRARQGRRRRAA